MSPENRRKLLAIARRSVEAAVTGRPLPEVSETDPELTARCGAFVTLKNHGRLRGCLGHFVSRAPLCELVNELARASATEDPRFVDDRVTIEELPEIDIEISVLSPLERIDDPLKIELGKHGIYIRRGGRQGCFLPQVALEQGWSKEEFLSYCCSHKAGLAPDAWRDPETETLVFTAEIVGERQEGRDRS
ncbi:MAG TPA: AmmeMemoRadiSam system protein A, partial [Candidatus Brocadiia bacterium]|nr:AmmeMemoRadiSam system protein A [Candidatus Brocadiia bacterium]